MTLAPVVAGVVFAFTLSAAAQARPRITSPVDKTNLVTLKGNTLPVVNALNDLGRVSDDKPTGRILMVLKHSPEQQAALDRLIQSQQSSASPSFHKWLTTTAYAQQFGVADEDIQQVSGYLSSQGFTVGRVFPNKMAIEFSGTAGQVRAAFKTEIHSFSVNGQQFFANDRDPQIPAALSPVVHGFSLNNYVPNAKASTPKRVFGGLKNGKAHALFTLGSGDSQALDLTPGDIAKIYDIPSTANGSGVTIGVVNTSNVNLTYVDNYQTTFSLPVRYPTVIVDGDDPGETANEIDGIEQLELLSAVAPNATLNYYVSPVDDASTGLTFALLRAVDDDQIQVLLMDKENCEANLGAVGTAFVNDVDEQASAEGISVIAAAGNGGSDSCQSYTGYGNSGYPSNATEGLSVNGYASTPFATAVGATDFYYGTNATISSTTPYWNQSGTSYTSALGYIPEQPLNLSYDGPSDAQTNIFGVDDLAIATGGGVSTLGDSNDDTTAPGPYPVPSWQTHALFTSLDPLLSGVGARAVPDISVFGGNNLNASSYVFCAQADECVNATPSTLVYETAGGTDVSSATFAGIAALIVQAHGAQGNLNPELYSLFQSTPSVFHAMAAGTNTVTCVGGTTNCGSGGYLVEPSTGAIAYQAYTSGYTAAAGLGSVDVANLLTDWSSPYSDPTTTTFTITSLGTSTPLTTFVHGTSVQGNVAVTSGAGTPTGDVAIISTTPLPNNKGVTWYTLSNGTVTDTSYLAGLPGGTYQLSARYAGGGTFEPSVSTPFTVTVTPETSTVNLINLVNLSTSTTTSVTFGQSVSVGALVFSATNRNSIGLPTGAVTVLDNGSTLTTVPLDATGLATFTAQLPVGSHSLTFSYPGDPSYNSSSTTTPLTVTVTAQPTTTIVSSTSNSDPTGSYVQLIATVSSSLGATTGIAPTGTVTFETTGGTVLGTGSVVPGTNNSGALAGIARYQLPGSHLGNVGQSIEAIFTPGSGSGYAGSTSTNTVAISATLTGGKTLSTTTLATSDGAASYFDYAGSITFNMTVARRTGTGATPTGTVNVFANGTQIGSGTLSGGVATLTIQQSPNTGLLLPPFTLGENLIIAQYSGNGTYGSSTSEIAITLLDEGSLPDFSLQSNVTYGTLSSSVTSTAFTLQLTSINNFAALGRDVSFGATGPTGLTCTFGSKTVTFGLTSTYATNTVTCTKAKSLAAGTYQVLVRASAAFAAKGQTNTSIDQEHTIPLQIVVE
jgi:hypothetical protein